MALALAACNSTRVAEAPVPPIDPGRLSHSVHAAIPCVACHDAPRPGANDHKPCDGCHRAAFFAPPGELCKVCHTKVTTNPLVSAAQGLSSRRHLASGSARVLAPEAPRRGRGRARGRLSRHVRRLSRSRRQARASRSRDLLAVPRARSQPAGLVTMGQCTGCHVPASRLRTQAQLIRGDLRFDHASHRVDRRGQAIRCEQCHDRTPRRGRRSCRRAVDRRAA